MDKSFVIKMAVVTGAIIGIVSGVYTLLPKEASGLSWAFIVGLSITLASQGELKKLPKYFTNEACGVIWGIAYNIVVGFFMVSIGMGLTSALIVGVGLVTTVAILVHHLLLGKTAWLNQTQFIFGFVACFFAVNGANWPYVLLSMMAGTACAVLLVPITMLFHKSVAIVEEEK